MPRLYESDPSGACIEWKAHALGRSSKQVSEFMQKEWSLGLCQEEAVKLVVQSLLDVVESGVTNIEI